MIKLALALVLGLPLGLTVLQHSDGIKVYQYTSSAWYYGEWYTRPPSGGATRVYFQGEPVGVKVQMHNESDIAVSFTNVKPLISQNFRVEVLSAPTDMVKRKLKEDFTNAFELLPTTGRIRSVPPSDTIRLGAKESLVAKFTIKMQDGGHLPEGVYKYRVRSLPSVASRDIIVNNDDFTFEVRQVMSDDDRIEVLRREASDAVFLSNNIVTSRKKIDALLKLHPNSDAAYVLLGTMEYRQRRLKLGIAAYEKALELIRTGKDTIVSKYKSKLLLDQAQGNVAATLRAWKEEQK
jgi:hypothetical protein